MILRVGHTSAARHSMAGAATAGEPLLEAVGRVRAQLERLRGEAQAATARAATLEKDHARAGAREQELKRALALGDGGRRGLEAGRRSRSFFWLYLSLLPCERGKRAAGRLVKPR